MKIKRGSWDWSVQEQLKQASAQQAIQLEGAEVAPNTEESMERGFGASYD